tara:strand:- start:831 stop:986 length:156 start_codon:yes stop_codon:yes gene_type:complete
MAAIDFLIIIPSKPHETMVRFATAKRIESTKMRQPCGSHSYEQFFSGFAML